MTARPAARRARRWSTALLAGALTVLPACAGAPTRGGPADRDGADGPVRVTLFGDSNTDITFATAEPRVRARSYVSDAASRPAPDAPNDSGSLAGLIERRWRLAHAAPIRVVNHAISGTTTGGGGHGGRDRNPAGAPNARAEVGGVTRFEGEVLGAAYPWSGGEPAGPAYPAGPIRRVNAYAPGPRDFAYVSLGTNDMANDGVPAVQTLENLAWMVDRWTAAGHAPDHLILTTLAPRLDRPEVIEAIGAANAGIRALAARTGVGLIDLAAYTTAPDGVHWRDDAQHVGDRLHYTTAVRAWLAERVVAYADAHATAR